MPNTDHRGYPYPSPLLPPAIPVDIQRLAEAVEADLETLTDPTWNTFTLGAGVTTWETTPAAFYAPGYRVRNGTAEGLGLIKTSGATTVGTVLLTITDPLKRPSRESHVEVTTQGGRLKLKVAPTGVISIVINETFSGWIDLTFLRWYTT